MPNVAEIKSEALKHFKAKEFDKALPLYKELWESHRDTCNEWEGWRYATCLKHIKAYKEALEICRDVYRINSNFEPIKETYAWCIYYTEIAIDKINDEKILFKAGEGIIKLSKQKDKSIKKENDFPCVYTLSVFKILDYLNKKSIYNPKQILYWTEKLNPDFLETTPFKFTDAKGKEREIAPLKEQWFSLRSKALYESKMFEECISLSETALRSLEKFHYDNDIWFKRNIALSKAGLGNYEIAINELKELLKKKKEWFIQKEISEIYLQQNKVDEALIFAVDAALNFGDADKKLNLYKLLYKILITQGKTDEAKAHIELIYQIRNSRQWNIDSELMNLIQHYKIDTSNLPDERELLRKLQFIWERLKFGNQELLKGIIRTIISDGKAGFIETDSKKSYFFSAKAFKGKRELMQVGQRVSFFLEDSFDKKKNQPTKIAVNIKPIIQ
jgi:tetratricopeptide (TPR) repeat protein